LRSHIRKNKSMNEMLWFYDDREFRQVVRMNQSQMQQKGQRQGKGQGRRRHS
jgi:hypothetical protein